MRSFVSYTAVHSQVAIDCVRGRRLQYNGTALRVGWCTLRSGATSADTLAYPIRILLYGPKKKDPFNTRYRSGELYNLDLSKPVSGRRSHLAISKQTSQGSAQAALIADFVFAAGIIRAFTLPNDPWKTHSSVPAPYGTRTLLSHIQSRVRGEPTAHNICPESTRRRGICIFFIAPRGTLISH